MLAGFSITESVNYTRPFCTHCEVGRMFPPTSSITCLGQGDERLFSTHLSNWLLLTWSALNWERFPTSFGRRDTRLSFSDRLSSTVNLSAQLDRQEEEEQESAAWVYRHYEVCCKKQCVMRYHTINNDSILLHIWQGTLKTSRAVGKTG